MADFVTLTLDDKVALLSELERRQVLGAVKSQGSGDRVATEFTGDTAHLLNQISKLQEAIRRDPGFDWNHPLWPSLMGANRPRGITRSNFGGAYGRERNPDGY